MAKRTARRMVSFRLPAETLAQIRWLRRLKGWTATEAVAKAVRLLWEQEVRGTQGRMERRGKRWVLLAGKDGRWMEIGWASPEVMEGAEEAVRTEMDLDDLATRLLLWQARNKKGEIQIEEPAAGLLLMALYEYGKNADEKDV
jgi:Arc/MetJ-type ribon-helix-helix transcriptional regulator